jgi:ribonuclease HII
MRTIIGVDEAGRGPLAGPVSVGAVLVPAGFSITEMFPGVADSKLLSEKKREELFSLLERVHLEGNVQYVVALASASDIDTKGISASIRGATAEALLALSPDPASCRVLLDGSLRAPAAYEQKTIIGGDRSEPIISLASIAAKVVRDRYMQNAAKQFPGYGFEVHKGYPTKAHKEAIRALGLCTLHRRSYRCTF